ncbi:hypothetical protein vB_Pae_PS44_00011 [Pseudomonas phage vB_Pae_PS44]|uniref:Uncharacterized protein n=2 Tax=Pbunavirus TaxID=1198980 RepID=A0A0F6SJE6_9CAUD|nr:hypothetical protein AVT16_gp11 [Pseudomonas phage vB_Pae_PS44]YP_009215126.1 hypothetical protein AVU24_gp08 [Pseudomonas phage DL68]UXD82823.1 hypothetical protein NP274_00047 [Pseudomonas phage Kara-mokiny kep-wari Wadjak 14]UXD82927.1 hypothetical protein NP274_00058 [Pseudomonas phage Kara-mokiny kep-wari Wadjak 15]AIW01565.1 hypothetical protein vB_Pae_PS44_00011 [Pseudomonas phage vB_Pae_PS44]AKF14068.1 hypothetical protein [Pseudomonas phage DL68]
MNTVPDPMKDKITLHGLGFIQVQLPAGRLHVWHPELPRRRCIAASSIHDHRFGFESLVLVGSMDNVSYYVDRSAHLSEMTHEGYEHSSARQACGGRGWDSVGAVRLRMRNCETVSAGQSYSMAAYVPHRTVPLGDGRVATIMRKHASYGSPSTSYVQLGVDPETDFDRYQWSVPTLWEVVIDVLGGAEFQIPSIP